MPGERPLRTVQLSQVGAGYRMSRVVLVSNRLPVTARLDGDQVVLERSAGGLATGLRRIHDRSDGVWVGWPGDVSGLDDGQNQHLSERLAEERCVPVHLSPAEITGYYDGFSNGVLWPLFHYLLDRIPPHSLEWEVYRRVNERFADAVASIYRPGDSIWVQDYQLTLVPQMIRDRLPSARVGYFLHVPFPATEVFRTLPWREAVLEGMLGADLLGFHTGRYLSHFSSSVLRVLGIPTQDDTMRFEGREISLGVFPIGVDAAALNALAEDEGVLREVASIRDEAAGQRIMVGIDRLDYTKGIPRRMLAFERLLEREPQWRGKVRLLQVAVPSRVDVPSYKDFRTDLEGLVGRINGAFSSVDWSPIHYVQRSFDDKRLAALYRAADVMLVTPLRDGMNLVAKEFVTCRSDEDGVLVLSEFAGAASEMDDAVQVNPYDIDGMAMAYHQALTMPEDERRIRMRALRQRIGNRDIHHWSQSFVDVLEGTPRGRERVVPSSREDLDALVARLGAAEATLLLLDYDGALGPAIPFAGSPGRELDPLLTALIAKPTTRVHLVSSRPRDTVERWFGHFDMGLYAEHGYWSRMSVGDSWTHLDDVDLEWKPVVRKILDAGSAAAPGTWVEEGTASLSWHWSTADSEYADARARGLWGRLMEQASGMPVDTFCGARVIEVRARGINKGRVVDRVLAAVRRPLPTIVAVGDEWVGAGLFRALPPEALTVGVGFQGSATRYRVARPRDVRRLLERIVEGR